MKHAALIVAALLALAVPARHGVRADAGPETAVTAVTSFGVSETQGWILAAGRLYTAPVTGGPWQDITPPLQPGWLLVAADLLGPADASPEAYAVAMYISSHRTALWRSSEGASRWSETEIVLQPGGPVGPPIASVQLEFVDAQHGWLALRHATSANFSTGELFATLDGGITWEQRSLPTGGSIYFTSPQQGWLSGGPAGDLAFQSTDGGLTWQEVALADLPVQAARLAGAAWTPGGALDAPADLRGWRVERRGACALPGDPSTCSTTSHLYVTMDGGARWQPIGLPPLEPLAALPQAGPAAPLDPEMVADIDRTRTELARGHGFDKCEVATIPELLDWYNSSPYRYVNVYYGGGSRACSNRALTDSYLRQMQAIGWRFIPTWVGKQAPCYPYTSKAKMSWDAEQAFIEGIEEANWASDRLTELGLTDAEGAGGVAYYDIEYYRVTDNVCHAAVQGFVTGWSAQMRARGNVAGVYSTGGILSGFANIAAPPDVVWAANWLTPYQFRPDASVWDVAGLSNSLWVSHQRIRQYTGGHEEIWGVTRLIIDSNVLDGVVGTVEPWSPVIVDRHRLPFILR